MTAAAADDESTAVVNQASMTHVNKNRVENAYGRRTPIIMGTLTKMFLHSVW